MMWAGGCTLIPVKTRQNFSTKALFSVHYQLPAQHTTPNSSVAASLHARSSKREQLPSGIYYTPSLALGLDLAWLGDLSTRAMVLPHTAAGMGLLRASTLFFCGIFLLDPAHGKCPNWCSQSGICTGPGDDAFCICEMGYQGEDCSIRELSDYDELRIWACDTIQCGIRRPYGRIPFCSVI